MPHLYGEMKKGFYVHEVAYRYLKYLIMGQTFSSILAKIG